MTNMAILFTISLYLFIPMAIVLVFIKYIRKYQRKIAKQPVLRLIKGGKVEKNIRHRY